MLLVDKWEDHRNTWINALSTRSQMGQTTMAVASDLVAKGYANLCRFFEESKSAQLGYFPGPVCAWFAMRMMDETIYFPVTASTNVQGKDKQWWTTKLKEVYSII